MWNEFRRRLWQPPRAHGDVVEDRTVSFLELFHDLVYVVVIAAAARTIAHEDDQVFIFALPPGEVPDSADLEVTIDGRTMCFDATGLEVVYPCAIVKSYVTLSEGDDLIEDSARSCTAG